MKEAWTLEVIPAINLKMQILIGLAPVVPEAIRGSLYTLNLSTGEHLGLNSANVTSLVSILALFLERSINYSYEAFCIQAEMWRIQAAINCSCLH